MWREKSTVYPVKIPCSRRKYMESSGSSLMWPPFRCKRTRSSRPGGGFANTRWNIYPIIYTLKCKHKTHTNRHKHISNYLYLGIKTHKHISNHLNLEMQRHKHWKVSLPIILFLKHLSDSLIFHPSWLPCWHLDCHWRKKCVLTPYQRKTPFCAVSAFCTNW